LIDYGDINIKFLKFKEDKIDLEQVKSKSSISISAPSDLFTKWVKHDKPKKLDLDLLLKLNNQIINQ